MLLCAKYYGNVLRNWHLSAMRTILQFLILRKAFYNASITFNEALQAHSFCNLFRAIRRHLWRRNHIRQVHLRQARGRVRGNRH